MIVIIGLGNPGKQYKNTRHNVGFMAIDKFAKENGFDEFKLEKKFDAEISKKDKVLLAKPQTFMNNSGKSAKKLKAVNKTATFMVLHDDVDLPIGKIKIVKERGSAGHKGVESVIRAIGNKGLLRVRIGVGGKKTADAMKIVLKNFTPAEQTLIKKTITKVAKALDLFVEENIEKAMNEYNQQ
ncbi:MAG TPA: aminoacyl-tRNA hydrolase [Candidatus Staskawiczbacteria bacterium]|nr:aminoacyl-tRNA hydrolase [Candidatus Staskawiczbacteria bacterium]